MLKLVVILLSCTGLTALADPPAFPTAAGFGARATGGRGGDVVHVTTLADAGPGSLREALAHGHRTILFDVGGYVELQSILKIPSDVTIAGQSAPGDGIGIRGHEVSFSGSKNVICRFVRIRQGLATKEEKKAAVGMHDAHGIILDHCSIQFGRWDTIDMTASSDVTIQWCIIGPGVAPQRFGCLCESDNVTFTHNLWIENQSRNPKAKGKIQFLNNVVYGWGKVGLVGGHSAADHFLDVAGNYFIRGPQSSNTFAGEFSATDKVYLGDNLVDLDADGELKGRPVTREDLKSATVVDQPWSTLPKIDSAADTYPHVIATAGCSLHRDTLDARLIADVTSLGKSGNTISDPADMGGFGTINPSRRDAKTALDAQKLTPDGYTQLEAYLNGLAGN